MQYTNIFACSRKEIILNNIGILDCTLRDGGYVNDFNFGENVIKSIIKDLSEASIDIIEVGFLKSGEFFSDKTLFGSVEAIRSVIGEKNPNSMYVAMIQYGKFAPEELAPYDGTSIDGIRLTFHEYEIEPSIEVAKKLMELGYKVFMQPVGTTAYTDSQLLDLIEKINSLNPFGFYLVDTLGIMYPQDMLRFFYLIDNNLKHRIALGFHSHNNMQLSFTNAQELIKIHTSRRKLILDSSVLGMGRGAGNLNTELITRYLNKNFYCGYDELKIMDIIDEYIRPLRRQFSWGYDSAYYIAAALGCHPNYASFLMHRETLHIQDMYNILGSLDADRKHLFNKQYIEEKYTAYLSHNIDDEAACNKIYKLIGDKDVILIAPGKSILRDETAIKRYIKTYAPYVISINFVPKNIPVDLVFVSNLKRFSGLDSLLSKNNSDYEIVVTSNITNKLQENFLCVNYSSYVVEMPIISDNAGIMCLNLLRKLGVQNVLMVGFDGFAGDLRENYFDSAMFLDVDDERLFEMNQAIKEKILQLKKQMNITFFNNSLYDTKINHRKNSLITSSIRGGGGGASW